MRPQEARRLVNLAFKPFYQHHDNLYPAFNKFKSKRTIEAVSQLIKIRIEHDKDLAKRWGDEYQEENCMYYEDCIDNESSVCNQMFYISDRWDCTGRLKFLKRVIELY